MKKILNIKFSFLLAAMMVFLFSCDTEDYTGYSTLEPTSPTIAISNDYSSINFIEQDSIFTFDVTLSEPQLVDVYVYIKQIAGDATEGDDFTILNDAGRLTIPFGSTTGQLIVKVLTDDVVEGIETFTLQLGDERTANATITPITVDFTINNVIENDLVINMTWETDVFDAVGLTLDPDEVINLRFLILDAADSSVIAIMDGLSFEEFGTESDTLLDGTFLPDGDYLIATDISSTIDAGDYNAPITIDLVLDFDQIGGYENKQLVYSGAFTNEFVCSTYRVYLANLTKSGTTYIFDDEAYSVPYHVLAGEWFGVDCDDDGVSGYFDYESQVVVVQGCALEISGLGYDWLQDFWGEDIVAGGTIELEVDMNTGIITIPNQYYCTTTYHGNPQDPYNIFGSGLVDMTGEYPTMTIEYELENYGYNWADWCNYYGYLSTPMFVANLTLDPAGLKSIANNGTLKFDLSKKPVR